MKQITGYGELGVANGPAKIFLEFHGSRGLLFLVIVCWQARVLGKDVSQSRSLAAIEFQVFERLALKIL